MENKEATKVIQRVTPAMTLKNRRKNGKYKTGESSRLFSLWE